MAAELTNIYEYNNFRQYLADFHQAKCKADGNYSASFVCRRLGLPHTRSYFRDVINGKQVTGTFVDRFITLLGLGQDESRYFRTLVDFNQAGTAELKEWHFERLVTLNRTPKRLVDPDAYLFYKEWYHTAIWAALDVFDFKDSYTGLSKKLIPPITVKQARQSVALLKKLGMIRKDERGFLKPVDKSITAGSYARDDLINQYQAKCLDLSKQAIVSGQGGAKNFSTMTLRISRQAYKTIEKRLQSFKAEVRSIAHKDEKPAEVVYQVNIQLFPNSK